jgi:hypothetical protein
MNPVSPASPLRFEWAPARRAWPRRAAGIISAVWFVAFVPARPWSESRTVGDWLVEAVTGGPLESTTSRVAWAVSVPLLFSAVFAVGALVRFARFMWSLR